jgi:AraC family transcriptional regulator
MQPGAFAAFSAADKPRAFSAAARSKLRATTSKRALAPWQCRCVEAYIAANLHSRIRMADLAGVAQCGPFRFKRSFKESFGCTPHQYVIRRRVERARRLMMISNESLSRISAECGFVDQFHLSHLFRKIVGQPPGTWRRIHASRNLRLNPTDRRTSATGPAA